MRNLEATDLPALTRILQATGAFTEVEIECAVELLEIVIAQPWQQDYRVAVAENDSQVAGYILYGPVPLTEGVYDIYWIATDPTVQGQGLGRRLMEQAEAEARRAGGAHDLSGDLVPGGVRTHPALLRSGRVCGRGAAAGFLQARR